MLIFTHRALPGFAPQKGQSMTYKGPLEIFGTETDVNNTGGASATGSNGDQGSANGQGVTTDQSRGPVPYDRFKDVNDRAKLLEDQNRQLLERVLTMQGTQSGQGADQAAAQAQQQVSQLTFGLDDAAKEALAQELLVDPGNAVERLLQAFAQRVDGHLQTREQALAQNIQQQFNPYVQQFQQYVGQGSVDAYARQAFANPQLAPVKPVFDQFVQQAAKENPALLTNQQGLDSLLDLAIGRAMRQGIPTGQLGQTQVPFSESAGFGATPNFSFAPQGGQPQIQVPQAVRDNAVRMGVDPEKAAQTYIQMVQRGHIKGGN